MSKFFTGKYKGIIASVALFLLLDASVLLMNFYISFEIADDAVDVNLAGRQRMLSQRMMKSLLDAKVSINDFEKLEQALNELQKTQSLFDTTLNAFDVGGLTNGANGERVELSPVVSPAGRQSISDAKSIWNVYRARVKKLLSIDRRDTDLVNGYLNLAIEYGKDTNLELLYLMNNLTVALEKEASSKAIGLRVIQTVGISLAIINFFIILFHFIRQLREGDEKVDRARRETKEILDTVNEGLFLINRKFIVGRQHSKSLSRIFDEDEISGRSFHEILSGMVSEKELDTAKSYIDILFKSSVKEKLTVDLNPLNEVEVHISRDGGYVSKFLNFSFKRVVIDGKITHILTTVRDVTEQVKLSRDLEKSKVQNEHQLEVLSTILHANPDMLAMFLDNAFQSFNRINSTLRQPVKSENQYYEKLTGIYGVIHNFKGEASALGLKQFVNMAHEFEERIEVLKKRESLAGTDFLSLAVILDKLIGHSNAINKIAKKLNVVSSLSNKGDSEFEIGSQHGDWAHLQKLADDIGKRKDKKVEVLFSGLKENAMPEAIKQFFNRVSIQFIRNSVCHGIETTIDRELSSKAPTGRIDIRLVRRFDGSLEYTFKDDGLGFDYDRIRETALANNMMTPQEAEILSQKELVSMIFHEGFSTSNDADEDSGRGMGMHAVQNMIKETGGKLSLASKKGKGCTFVITLPSIKTLDAVA